MCDTTRRCDRPSCPCNEPDTELKDALARMQERFPAPWQSSVEYDDFSEQCCAAANMGGTSGVDVHGYGPTPHAAVDAAINAWDAAVKADALYAPLKAECEASRSCFSLTGNHVSVFNDGAALRKSRAATDKAGALR